MFLSSSFATNKLCELGQLTFLSGCFLIFKNEKLRSDKSLLTVGLGWRVYQKLF